ncbi:MAG: helix-turn-helix transcriptional regulator [Clostridia bacterium]|nr:helix-turn-helix transcriptional regulator [Clostridia bacterium]
MGNTKFIITEYFLPLPAFDKKGHKIEFESRYCSSFIVTFSGKIKFTTTKNVYFCDKDHPIFLPEGLKYTNECIEDAESIVFNFKSTKFLSEPIILSPIPENIVRLKYEKMKQTAFLESPMCDITVLSEFYSLAEKLFMGKVKNQNSGTSHKTVEIALEFMMKNYNKSNISSKDIAAACFISEIYLRKLFMKELGTTPFKKLTEMRMSKASLLIMEKRPISEIAERVGYSDVYSFSRAFKHFYGTSPTKYTL